MVPTDQNNGASLVDWLRLHMAFLYQPQVVERLLEKFGDPERIFRTSPVELGITPRISPAVCKILGDRGWAQAAEMELDGARKEGISVLRRGGPEWPENLRGPDGMPLILFCRGKLLSRDLTAVGVVGSRRPSRHGLHQANRFAARLASLGVTVVSGLARGIDAAAHQGALEAGGRTIGVLGSGLGRIYPRENLDLARRISSSGALLSEFPRKTPPRQFHFPHRNRILSALSLGVLVVEAGERSGSLITANWAIEQNREVFALPGRVDAMEARGGLRLLQDGARLVIEPEEIAEVLGIHKRPGVAGKMESRPAPLPAHLETLFQEEEVWHADRLIQRLQRSPGEVLAELSRLEAAGLLVRIPGGAYAKNG